MNMKRLLTLVAFFATVQASAQQVNPVPDYVFANRMSAGRNTVTDTAAYFSIGPRYGATRGMMPPMVVDTASFSGNRRNGLLIFSVQKNKFLYWDSVGAKWAEMAGTAGTALTSADTAALLSTRAWRQKGIDSLAVIRIAGSGTTNRSAKFTESGTIGNGSIADSASSVAMTILSSGNIGIATVAPAAKLDVNGASIFRGSVSVVSANSNLSFNADYSALGDIPSGSIIFSNTSTNQNVSIVSAGAGTAGTKVVGAAYNGTNWRSMMEYANVASGEPALLLAKTAGFVAIGSSTPSTLRLLVQGQGAGAPSTSGTSQTGPFRLANTFSATVTDFGFDTNNNAWIQVSNKDNLGIRYNLLLNQNGGEVIIGNSSDAGVYALQVTGNIYTNQTLTTGAPTSGSAKPWRLGEAATVSPTSPNRTIRVEIDGTVYYLHAKTTND